MLEPESVKLLRSLPMQKAVQFWTEFEAVDNKKNLPGKVRALCISDLFYLLVKVCKRTDMLHPWIYERVREVETEPDNCLDLWAREHYKSTVITFGLTIQDILKDPDITVGIFSHTRPIAKAFLRQIQREFEQNKILHTAFPDILWGENTKESPKWSEDDGLIVKRSSNPNEATIEAWGVVDGQPTSKHFKVLLYDDVVVQGSVTTPEMIEKTMSQLENSYNLIRTNGGVKRFVGTRWHFNDAYSTLIKRGTAKLRFYPGTDDGTESGNPVLWTEETLKQKRRDMGPYSFASNILLNPKADALQGFKREWIRKFKHIPETSRTNNYILVDAASSKKKGSDYTAIWLVRLGTDSNYYCYPLVRDRLNLSERGDRLFEIHRKWKPKQVRYEKYGLMADVEHLRNRMEVENYRFDITEVGGQTSKEDRIKRLLPLFEQGRIWLPQSYHVADWEKIPRDLVHDFIEEEYMAFPVASHDDLLDSLSRITEPNFALVWPKEEKPAPPPAENRPNAGIAWMG